MKARLLFLYVFVMFSSFVYSQEEAFIASWEYSPHIVKVSLCDGFKHVYANLEPIKPGADDGITEVEFSFVDRPSTSYRAQKGPRGFEVNFYNVPESVRLELNATFFDRDRNVVNSRTISASPREEGIINVSTHMDAMLGRFAEGHDDIAHYFCNESVSEIELIAFFQEFLGLTENEMCVKLQQYNLYFMGYSGAVDETWVSNLCEEFADFVGDTVGDDGGNGGDENDCACNMIRTNRTSHNATSIPVQIDAEDQCNDYMAWTGAENAETNDDDDNLIFTQGRLGAAKGSALIWNYDGGDDSPDPFKSDVKPSWSQLTFRMVCVDPNTISPDLENCSTCKKTVELDYGYYSYASIYGEKQWHISGSEFGFRSEDWAVMAVQNGDYSEVIDSYGETFVIDCELPEDHPSISETLTDANSIVSTVIDLVGNFTPAGLLATGIEIIDFIETHISSQYCSQYETYEAIAMSPDEELIYELIPGRLFKAVMISGGSVSGKVANNGEGWLIVNTDSYLAAVLKTVPNEDGEVPDYCECERIGNYALASLDNTTPAIPHIWDDISLLDFKPPSTVFDKVHKGTHNLKEIVGQFIGSEGPWNPKYNSIGCCSDIYPNCLSECIYLSGCDIALGLQGSDNGQSSIVDSRYDLATGHGHFKFYPNPVSNDQLLLESLGYEQDAEVRIYNLTGQLQYATKLTNSSTINISTNSWKAGLYSIIWSGENGEILHQDKVVVIK